MPWNLTGTYFENCSCDVMCSCITSPNWQADKDHCWPTLAFHVDSGAVDGVDVSGHTVVVVAQTGAVMFDGNWRVGLIIDDAASEAQAGALGQVFSGELGGPMATLAPLISEVLGVERAPIEYADEGTTHRLKVGDMVDMEVEDFVPPGFDTPMTITPAPHPANTTLRVARATRAKVKAFGFEWDNEGKNGHSAPFSWSA